MKAENLDLIHEALIAGCDLSSYAASDAARTLIENWKVALSNGQTIDELIGDIDGVVNQLGVFKMMVTMAKNGTLEAHLSKAAA